MVLGVAAEPLYLACSKRRVAGRPGGSGLGHTDGVNASSSTSVAASAASLVWVESMGGPLIVVPVSALAAWRGCTETGVIAGDATAPDDYDRACAVDDPVGVIAVGDSGTQALVLADEPATSCYLPEHRTFLHRLAVDSAAELKTTAEAVLADPATEWEEYCTWTTDGPAVLMDSGEAGTELSVAHPGGGMPDQAPVPLPAGRWRVRAVDTEAVDALQAASDHATRGASAVALQIEPAFEGLADRLDDLPQWFEYRCAGAAPPRFYGPAGAVGGSTRPVVARSRGRSNSCHRSASVRSSRRTDRVRLRTCPTAFRARRPWPRGRANAIGGPCTVDPPRPRGEAQQCLQHRRRDQLRVAELRCDAHRRVPRCRLR